MADSLGENLAHPPCPLPSPRISDFFYKHYEKRIHRILSQTLYSNGNRRHKVRSIKYISLFFCNHNVHRNNITRHANATRLHVRPNTIPAGGRTRKITRESKTQNKRDVKKYFHLVSFSKVRKLISLKQTSSAIYFSKEFPLQIYLGRSL